MAQGLAHSVSLLRGASKSHANNLLAWKCGLSRPPEQGNVTGREGMVTLPNESGDKRGRCLDHPPDSSVTVSGNEAQCILI